MKLSLVWHKEAGIMSIQQESNYKTNDLWN